MRVKCITNLLVNPSQAIIKAGWDSAKGYLTIGKEYDVLAIRQDWIKGETVYLVCDDNYDGVNYVWPIHIPALFFEIVDGDIPNTWVNKDTSMGPSILLDVRFYDALLNCRPQQIRIFQAFLRQITNAKK